MYRPFYNVKRDRVIYIFLSKDKKTYFIDHCFLGSERETFRHHFKQRRFFSKPFMQQMEGVRPCMFALENLYDTEEIAVRHKIAWNKIFMENGYKSLNGEAIDNYSTEMYTKTKLIYNQLCENDVNEIISCENCIVKQYRNTLCEQGK